MEPSKISPNVINLAMPRGALSFAAFDDDGVNTGEIDLGNVASFDLTNAIGYKPHMTSHESVVVLDAVIPAMKPLAPTVTAQPPSAGTAKSEVVAVTPDVVPSFTYATFAPTFCTITTVLVAGRAVSLVLLLTA